MASKNKNKSAAPKVGDATAEPKAAATAAPAIEPGEGVTGKTSEDETKVAQASSNAVPEYEHIVIVKFEDKNKRGSFIKEGTDVSGFDAARLKDLVMRKLVERRLKA